MPIGLTSPGSMLITSLRNGGISQLDFGGIRPWLFGVPGQIPVPGFAWITDGFRGSGSIFTLHLPRNLARMLRNEPTLHQYRPADEQLAPEIARLPWLV